MDDNKIAAAITDCLIGSDLAFDIEEGANIVDILSRVAIAGKAIANAITPLTAMGTTDEAGGHVESLTEAAMSISSALFRIGRGCEEIAQSLSSVAHAIDSFPSSSDGR